MWRHRSRVHSNRRIPFPICGQWALSLSLSPFSRYWAQSAWPVQIVNAHARYHVTCTPMHNLGTYFNFSPHITYSLWHFHWAHITNKGCLLLRPPMLNAKSSENFQSWPKFGKFWRFWECGVSKRFDFYCKRHICARIHVVWAILPEDRLGDGGLTPRRVGIKS